jgi:hypothetical protein
MTEDVREQNRAVLDAVRIRRDDLYESILGLERALAIPAGDAPDAWGAALADPVARLQEVLAMHVEGTEGPGGLFDQLRDDAPHLLHAADVLGAEHGPLLDAASALANRLAAVRTDADVEEVRDAALDLVRELLEHRHRGAELLYDAYQVDISSGD